MKVKKIAFGDKEEAFVESRLTDGVNIIFSDDNNRGKTLVMQGLMYSIGYESIFPSTFNYRDKYFYSEIEIDGGKFEFLRKGNSLIVKAKQIFQIFNSISEFRYFFDKHIINLPKIYKENKLRTVGLSLFYELFFVGQDSRNPAGLISKGHFNKSDYKNMIYTLSSLSSTDLKKDDTKEVKDKIKKLKLRLREVRKKINIVKSNPRIAEIVSKTYDSERVQAKIKSIKELNERISKLSRSRQREINRKSKLESLVSELNSLNRGLSEGDVKCGECGSDKIVYTNKDLTFEVSNLSVRNSILASIAENIIQKQEVINEYNTEINELQSVLNKEISDSPPNFQQMIIYQEQITSDRNYDDEAFSIIQQLKSMKEQLNTNEVLEASIQVDRRSLDQDILLEMARLYKAIDPNGNLEFYDIFTKKDSTFSGSEEQEFYFSKVIALNNILSHKFPIIVDSFRDGEISTAKETDMLRIYERLNKQVILTATLKNEEYESKKYVSNDKVNALDYSNHDDYKLLTKNYSNEFSDLMNSFHGIMI